MPIETPRSEDVCLHCERRYARNLSGNLRRHSPPGIVGICQGSGRPGWNRLRELDLADLAEKEQG